MVLLLHWFIPYKVERRNVSFQCGTKEFKEKARQLSQKSQSQRQRILEYLHKQFIDDITSDF